MYLVSEEARLCGCSGGVVTETGVGVEPLVKVLGGVKHVRQQEVKQSPELVQVVLQRGSRQQQTVRRLNLTNYHGQFALFVLDSVGLVDDHVLPVELLEHALLPKDQGEY